MSEVLYIMNSQKNGGLLGVEEAMAFLTLLLTLLEYIKNLKILILHKH